MNPTTAIEGVFRKWFVDLQQFLSYQKDLGVSEFFFKEDQAMTPASQLNAIRQDLGDCTRCKLHSGRNHIVFGVGNPEAELVFVGEGPGRDEDLKGEPFVGRAGQLLTRIIEAMGLTRNDVYIANIIKCRPPNNRNPEPDEISTCEPFLKKQLEAIHPRVICALGTFAAQTLLKTDTKISQLRGKFHSYEGIKLMATFHPAYLLRNPREKRKVWEDMQLVMGELSLLKSESVSPGMRRP